MKSEQTKSILLQDHEKDVAELVNPNGKAPIILICEHASNYIPKSLNNLGISDEELASHAAWDIGAYDLACKLSELIDAPLVASRISRLVYDCNREPIFKNGLSRATPSKSEVVDVPGNKHLNDNDFQARVSEVYEPFHAKISELVKTHSQKHTNPAIITIHSFTPIYFDDVRTVEIGILHDNDDRLAIPLMKTALEVCQLKTEFNSPYGVNDDVMHTVHKHAAKDNLLNVMIEVKNDLLLNDENILSIASNLGLAIQTAVAAAQDTIVKEI